MAEQLTKQPALTGVIDGEYMLEVREFDAGGKGTTISVPMPDTIEAMLSSIKVTAIVLKQSSRWKNYTMPQIIYAIWYAKNMGLDIAIGDVYMTPDGNLATTSAAKIRHAMASGKIAGYEVKIEDGPAIEIPYKLGGRDCTWKGKNLKATVTVSVKGWENPMTYETTLAEWFMGSNPNWRTRPAYMLRRNALSKALEEVAPMGTESDEAPLVDLTPAQ